MIHTAYDPEEARHPRRAYSRPDPADDLTREQVEQRMLEAALEKANQELAQFMYIASHDLTDPTRVIMTYSRLLEERYSDRLDPDGRFLLQTIGNSARDMMSMIRALLEFSRTCRQTSHHESVDLMRVLEDAAATLEVALHNTGAKLVVEKLPTVRADPQQLVQVFQNLLGNAIKFRHPERPPVISVTARALDHAIEITVTDNGMGIESRHFDRIFGLFQRLHHPDSSPGTGLGLAICRKIVEQHEGEIWVESEPGIGSSFRFTLPADFM
jgi:light-regulated signal transduction histidine kinase (bacteriophytochrome)